MHDCLFCKIVNGEIPSYKIYEDDRHIAVLDIFPSAKGQCLIIPKKHFVSYVFEMPCDEYIALMVTTKIVARLIDEKLGAVRTCMVMEGMEVDHAHIKLYPIHEVVTNIATGTANLNKYMGYLITLHGERMPDSDLEELAKKFEK